MADWSDYEWLLVVGSIVAFMMAWSIGANDVANSFATSVGSKSLTIFQAVLIAICCEFVGAMLLGGQVVKTIAGGIADPNAFAEDPEFLAYGMLCALTAAWLWVTVATMVGLAVSTTHSIVQVGGIMGFALIFKGSDAVIWYQKAVVVHNDAEYKAAGAYTNYRVADDQVPIRGLVPIVISWFTSPVCCCFIAALHFFLVRTLVMRRKRALLYSFFALPLVVLYCIFLNTFFVVYKGGKTGVCSKGSNGAATSSKYSETLCYIGIDGSPTVKSGVAAWIAAAVGGGIAILVAIFIVPFIVRRANNMDENGVQMIKVDNKPAGFATGSPTDFSQTTSPTKGIVAEDNPNRAWYLKAYDKATYGVRYDIHAAVSDDAVVRAMQERAEKFDPRAEQSFRPVQVFTSMAVSFAHGANDVANAVGPLAAIYQVYKTRSSASSADLPTWILAIGACGIVVGLSTYGYNIMRVLGTEMVVLTPSRGFCAELATALVVSVGSLYGFPLSTTHSQTGSTIGVGIMEGGFRGVNWILFVKQIAGWVATIIIAGFVSAALFAQACYAPSIIMARDIERYEVMAINTTHELITKGLDATFKLVKANAAVGPPAVSSTTGAFTGVGTYEASYLTAAKTYISTDKKTFFQNITLANGKKRLIHAPVISSIDVPRFVYATVKAYKDASVLVFGQFGAGWDKASFQSARGTAFATAN